MASIRWRCRSSSPGRPVRQGHRRGEDGRLRARRCRVGQLCGRARRGRLHGGGWRTARAADHLENAAASIEANLQADFNTGRIAADGTITYRPGEEALVGSEPALRFSLEAPSARRPRTFDSEPLAQFLTQRALEIEQARVEAMQSALLEKQRLRREVRYYAALQEASTTASSRNGAASRKKRG